MRAPHKNLVSHLVSQCSISPIYCYRFISPAFFATQESAHEIVGRIAFVMLGQVSKNIVKWLRIHTRRASQTPEERTMIARRVLRGAPLSASSSFPLVSLPLVQSLLTFVSAQNSPEPLLSCSSPSAHLVSKPSPWQSTIHAAPCTRHTALQRSPLVTSVSAMAGLTSEAAAANGAGVTPEDVLRYWFKDADLEKNKFPVEFWFLGGEAIDNEIKEKFGDCLERAIRGEFENWKSTPRGRVALVLVFDQFSRNCHRDSHRSYAQDQAALQIALDSIHQGVDQQLSNPLERYFLYMPLMHSESLEVHKEAHVVFQKLVEDHKDNPELSNFFQGVVKFLKAHTSVLAKFGRYPSRNVVFGRTSTLEEEEYLARGRLWSMED